MGLHLGLNAQRLRDPARDVVAMRMIAHQLMLWQGDSSQAIPPVIPLDETQYRINFNTDLQFTPEAMVDFIAKVMRDYTIAEQYRVQVRSCLGDTIVYSFQVGGIESGDIVPCLGRQQKKACYYLQVSILDTFQVLAADKGSVEDLDSEEADLNSKWFYFFVFLAMVIAAFWKLMLKKSKMPDNKILTETKDSEITWLGSTQFSEQRLSISFNNVKTELSAKESDLLAFLAQHLNQRVEKERILEAVWGDDGDYVGRTLDVFISKLRKKLALDTSIRIVNIRGIGYQLQVVED
tara:strand:- start:152783 stop:153661 length:879 start_codon:yes stop_codon:yes gene_type:complete